MHTGYCGQLPAAERQTVDRQCSTGAVPAHHRQCCVASAYKFAVFVPSSALLNAKKSCEETVYPQVCLQKNDGGIVTGKISDM